MTTSNSTITSKNMKTNLEPKKQYTTFYSIMLIVSACLAVFSISSFMDLPKVFDYYTHAPLFVTFQLLDYLAVAAAGVGLVLLFQKRRLGLLITLGSLAAQFILACVLFFFIDEMAAFIFATGNPADFPSANDRESYISFVRIAMYVLLPIGLIINAAFAVLWHAAWQKQSLADHLIEK